MKTLIEYAKSFIGTNYLWGGNNAIEGFDCSGLVQEILASVGLDPEGRDTAQSLYNILKVGASQKNVCEAGTIIFYGKDTSNITHIAFAIDGHRIIEAGGGGSKTVDKNSAAKISAQVRIRPYNRRKDIAAMLLPIYPDWVIR
jgi:cell wall-associated NlpC family hydrolase